MGRDPGSLSVFPVATRSEPGIKKTHAGASYTVRYELAYRREAPCSQAGSVRRGHAADHQRPAS